MLIRQYNEKDRKRNDRNFNDLIILIRQNNSDEEEKISISNDIALYLITFTIINSILNKSIEFIIVSIINSKLNWK